MNNNNISINDTSDLIALRQYGCSYLGPEYDVRTWDYAHKPTPYCGCKDLVEGALYCESHWAIMGQHGTALRKRRKDIARAATIQDIASLFNDVVAELENAGELEL
jgi:hypothetical protein